uniref:Uncharacterized protein n=1 Tax=Peronospora matthiolae TaxID=2874970 RepID=A0AAV1TN41_9STRA
MAFVGSVSGISLAITVPGLFPYEVARGYLVSAGWLLFEEEVRTPDALFE